MRLVIRDEAARDLEDIFAYIGKDNPRAAREMIERLRARMDTIVLPALLNIGRRGLAPLTRELVEPPYIIVYEFDDLVHTKTVTILSVVHRARNR